MVCTGLTYHSSWCTCPSLHGWYHRDLSLMDRNVWSSSVYSCAPWEYELLHQTWGLAVQILEREVCVCVKWRKGQATQQRRKEKKDGWYKEREREREREGDAHHDGLNKPTPCMESTWGRDSLSSAADQLTLSSATPAGPDVDHHLAWTSPDSHMTTMNMIRWHRLHAHNQTLNKEYMFSQTMISGHALI